MQKEKFKNTFWKWFLFFFYYYLFFLFLDFNFFISLRKVGMRLVHIQTPILTVLLNPTVIICMIF